MLIHPRFSAMVLLLCGTVSLRAAEGDIAAHRVHEVIAHRGSSIDRPENTLAAFRRAIEAGASITEVDVRTSRDGILVCLHDAELSRTTNGTGKVGEKTLAQMRKLDAGARFDPRYRGERIPTLREVLTLCRGKIEVMLDLKETGKAYVQNIAETVRTFGEEKRTVLGVRTVADAKRLRDLLPGARQIGLIPTTDTIDAFADAGVPIIRLWPRWLTDRAHVARLRKRGLGLLLGAGKGTRAEVAPLLAHGPDILSSDDPERLRRTLTELAGRDDRPNIVVVLADDLGYGDLGCQGNKVVKTPNLDRFAREGLRLTSCYSAAPNCSPSRAGLLTGRTPLRIGIHDWIPMLSPMHLRMREVTIATLLRRAGYGTAQAGKWHLNGMFNLPGQPQPGDHGFDHWFSTQNNALPNHRNPYNFVRNGIPVGAQKGYSAALVTDEAVHWLTRTRDRKKPFFLFVCFHEPHEPIATDSRYADMYDPRKNPSRAAHHGNITQMDDAFGRLMRTLESEKLRDNTLVLFTSDNGPAITSYHPHGSAGPLREKKGHLYEGGIRVPGIIRWPGHIRPGTISDEPVCGVDVLPTLCEISGIRPPTDRALDGTSIVPLFRDKPMKRTTPLFWHFFRAQSKPRVAMRIGDWKLLGHLDAPTPTRGADIVTADQLAIHKAELSSFELYNLREDTGEKNDLARREPARLKAMATQMRTLYRQARDESPTWPAWKWPRYEAGRIQWPEYRGSTSP